MRDPNVLYITKPIFGLYFWLKTASLLLVFAFIISGSVYYAVYLIQNRTYLVVGLILMFVTYSNFLVKGLVAIINLEKNVQKEQIKIKETYTKEGFGVYPLVSFDHRDNPFDSLPKA